MKESKLFIGCDVSKKTLDFAIRTDMGFDSHCIANTPKAIRKFLGTHILIEKAVICMENTGRFNWQLLAELVDSDHDVYVVNPIHISKSQGLVRGKSDKVDAERICSFIQKNHDELPKWSPSRDEIVKLGLLLTERKRMMKMRTQTRCAQKDLDVVSASREKTLLTELNISLINQLSTRIKSIESMISELIASDEGLEFQNSMLNSVIGCGKILSWNLIYKTNEFKSINDPRKLACYAGIAPFGHSSGTSIRGRNRVSNYADKDLKGILHLAAMSAIRLDGELRSYYLRKVEEGKNKMSVLNAVRNKIVHRACATIRKGEPYLKDLVVS